MSLSSAIQEGLNKRGKVFILRIQQELKSAGKSATGSLILGTKGGTRVEGSRIVYEAFAPMHYIFVDQGRQPGSKMPPIKPIKEWISRKGLDLNAFAVAKSIAKKGIKPTRIYTNAIARFKNDLDLSATIKKEIINDIKK